MSRTGRPRELPSDRFWKYVKYEDKNGCWNWLGGIAKNGYGKFYDGARFISAHRYSWILHNRRAIPDGMFILHKCDNPRCVNPDHLYCGSQSDNMVDRSKRDRLDIRTVSRPRFYEGEIWLMKKLYIANIGQDMISKIFKTSQSSVSRHVRDCYKVPFKYLQGGCHV